MRLEIGMPALGTDSLWTLVSAVACAREQASALPMHPWLNLLLALFVGRILLSLLPAGLPGAHRLVSLPITLASSYALGRVALHAETSLWGAEIWQGASLWLALSPWLVLLVLRFCSLPAAMLPRHRLQLAAITGKQKLLLLVGFSALALQNSAELERNATWIALMVIITSALRQARMPALAWSLAPLVGALYVFLAHNPGAPIEAGLGASFSIAWLLRAERRACVLACIGFGALWPSAPLLAAAGFLTLLALSHRPQRKYALGCSLATSALFAITLLV